MRSGREATAAISSTRKAETFPGELYLTSDPAARYYVLALRYAGTQVYLKGKPLFVDVYGHGNAYPNARVLVVKVLRHPTRRASFPPSLDDIVSQVQRSDQIEMIVSLSPGEDFEIDVWCIPDPAYLAERFAVIEGVGTRGPRERSGNEGS